MKNLLIIIAIAAFSSLFLCSPAFSYTIDDKYIGGQPNSTSYYGEDVIGATSDFQIRDMDVSYTGNALDLTINSTFFDASVGRLGVELGDLFISTNGWAPELPTSVPGAIPTIDDDSRNGEFWEYAVVLSEYTDLGNDNTETGTVQLYAVNSKNNIVLSNSFFNNSGYIYREYQEVRYNPSVQQRELGPLAIGKFSWQNEMLNIKIDDFLNKVNGTELAYHYTFTCGNDVIEGVASVPEPANMFLMGTGLLGLAALGRRKFFKR